MPELSAIPTDLEPGLHLSPGHRPGGGQYEVFSKCSPFFMAERAVDPLRGPADFRHRASHPDGWTVLLPGLPVAFSPAQ